MEEKGLLRKEEEGGGSKIYAYMLYLIGTVLSWFYLVYPHTL
jgi:hypothetical protein